MSFYNPADRTYETLPEIINGYLLEQRDKGWISVIAPEDGINLITNTSFEKDTVGWTANNSTIARSTTKQKLSLYSLKVTPSSTALAGTYYTVPFTPVTASPYTFSFYIFGWPGDVYQAYVADGAGSRTAVSQLVETRGNGYWQRVVSVHSGGVAPVRLYITRKAGGTVNPFYVDCAQVEEKSYPTTYFDGDTLGISPGATDYWWYGEPHASVSYRRATSNGGKEVNLLDIGFRLLAIVGMGAFPHTNITSPVSSGGALYQRSVYGTREFTIAGSFDGSTLPQIRTQRQNLFKMITPFGVSPQQPITMTYHQYDDAGNETDTIDWQAAYQSGLEGSLDNLHQDRAGIVFKQFIPFLQSRENAITPITTSALDVGGLRFVTQDFHGVWRQNPISNIAYSSLYRINTYAVSGTGKVYVGGFFEYDGGSYINLASYDGVQFDYLKVGASFLPTNSQVSTLLYDGINRKLYIGGSFTSVDGVANTAGIACFDEGTATFTALGTGAPGAEPFMEVKAMVSYVDSAGILKIYVGGSFASMGGVANTANLAVWYSGAWHSVGSGMSDDVRTLAIDSNGVLYAGGDFTDGGATRYIVKVNQAGVFSTLGTGVNDVVKSMAIGRDGILYVGGDFTEAGGLTGAPPPGITSLYSFAGLAMWNGAAWSIPGKPPFYAEDPMTVDKILAAPDGSIYIGLTDTYLPGMDPSNLWVYNGTNYHPASIYSIDPIYPGIFHPVTGELYLSSGADVRFDGQYTDTINNNTYSRSYPTIYMQGPIERVHAVFNETTGRTVWFDPRFGVSKNEVVRLIASPSSPIQLISSVRGNIGSLLAGDSSSDFFFDTGVNYMGIIDNRSVLIESAGTEIASVALFGQTNLNTASGVLYVKGDYVWSSGVAIMTVTFDFYTDPGMASGLVAHCGPFAWWDGGWFRISEDNASGLSGVMVFTALVHPDHSYTQTYTLFTPLYYTSQPVMYQTLDEARK